MVLTIGFAFSVIFLCTARQVYIIQWKHSILLCSMIAAIDVGSVWFAFFFFLSLVIFPCALLLPLSFGVILSLLLQLLALLRTISMNWIAAAIRQIYILYFHSSVTFVIRKIQDSFYFSCWRSRFLSAFGRQFLDVFLSSSLRRSDSVTDYPCRIQYVRCLGDFICFASIHFISYRFVFFSFPFIFKLFNVAHFLPSHLRVQIFMLPKWNLFVIDLNFFFLRLQCARSWIDERIWKKQRKNASSLQLVGPLRYALRAFSTAIQHVLEKPLKHFLAISFALRCDCIRFFILNLFVIA